MIDQRFYLNTGPYTATQLKEYVGCELKTNNPELVLHDVAPLDNSAPTAVSFFSNKKYIEALKSTKAGLCILHPDYAGQAPETLSLLITPTPYRVYAKIASLFYPDKKPTAKISEHAIISPTAKIGTGCTIDAFAVIGDNVEIGDNTHISSHVTINDAVRLGQNCYVGPTATISHSIIGNYVYIKPGARIGQKGFGFDMDSQGHLSVPQLGRVIIEDYVEIGANSTIDRGASTDTIIGKGSRIDNLVQLAHNVVLGNNCVIVAQVGIAGSTKLGNFVIAAGQAGIAGHLNIGDNVRIAAQSGIMRDIPSGEDVMGSPAIKIREFFKQTAILSRLAKGKER